jgi:hypothetical protein
MHAAYLIHLTISQRYQHLARSTNYYILHYAVFSVLLYFISFMLKYSEQFVP